MSTCYLHLSARKGDSVVFCDVIHFVSDRYLFDFFFYFFFFPDLWDVLALISLSRGNRPYCTFILHIYDSISSVLIPE